MAGKLSNHHICKKESTEDDADIMVHFITESTLKQYECSFKSRWEFTHLRDLDIFHEKTSDIINFLNNRFKGGASYDTLNTA